MAQWLKRESTDRKVCSRSPNFPSRFPSRLEQPGSISALMLPSGSVGIMLLSIRNLSRLGQPGSIPALVQPSGGMSVRHRKGATAERCTHHSLGDGNEGDSLNLTAAPICGQGANVVTEGSLVRTQPRFRDCSCLGLGNLTASQPLVMTPDRSTRTEMLPGCPSLDRNSRDTRVGFEPRSFRSMAGGFGVQQPAKQSNITAYTTTVSSHLIKSNLKSFDCPRCQTAYDHKLSHDKFVPISVLPDSISVLMHPSDGMASMDQRDVRAGRLFLFLFKILSVILKR
ncbi:hypothetical protein CSKR_108217 [Clonorchis sinensis]|uniref:Uncharacterized protein n=1 Tax=Clonorchis sinensis TaxID=79923 RepID=A0A419PRQ0_CLOSI|nr:hypothetical protein CSKR_108217 [Clonorchis sinensis]